MKKKYLIIIILFIFSFMFLGIGIYLNIQQNNKTIKASPSRNLSEEEKIIKKQFKNLTGTSFSKCLLKSKKDNSSYTRYNYKCGKDTYSIGIDKNNVVFIIITSNKDNVSKNNNNKVNSSESDSLK